MEGHDAAETLPSLGLPLLPVVTRPMGGWHALNACITNVDVLVS